MKSKTFSELTKDELRQRYDETHQELFNLRVQHSTGQLENPLRLRELRRDVARILTVLKQKEGSK